MPERRAAHREIESLDELDRLVAAGATSMRHWRLQSVDLRGRGDVLRRLDPRGALLLGCLLDPDTEDHLRRHGALVFPRVPDVPVDPYRAALYTPEELYAGLAGGYDATPDARAYVWHRGSVDLTDRLAQALHDHAIDDALAEYAESRRLVGVMGGHAIERGAADYVAAARLGRDLGRAGLTVATGGGPGAMEAANLGGYLAGQDDDVLDEALTMLTAVPSYRQSVGAWAEAALAVRRRWEGEESLGVPTWFYGHEPPNPMASHIAKYFKNAIREDILLHVCGAGIVFLPGRAGTVQEVFQDACENYYADDRELATMVLVGVEHWTRELPAWPLLESLARDRAMSGRVHLVDSVEEAVDLVSPA
ncbi:MAG TPA: Rossmann fold nucleotide-binding protein [Nocardioides sp.]|uniref:LOG family protein n=1 Tax=Nocardioides sp. TaxID=35761 RepID=UPI002D804490|nr:Rossmann fold nucleotide-binding protein [Nocardioides sp.]HET6653269.1 Rossmann fold nucleotide-binding protein [Nocardioides sp.]